IAMLCILLIAFFHSLSSGGADLNVDPIYYNVSILTRLDGGSAQNRYEGFVGIDVMVKNSTKKITIFASDLNLFAQRSWLLRKTTGRRISVVKATRNKKSATPDELTIFLTHTLRLGEVYTLYMYFQGALNRPQKFGYFSVRYNTPEPHFYAITHMEPVYARYVIPCFDQPHFRTKFHLQMIHNKQYVALSNMPVAEKKAYPLLENYEMTIFEDSPPLPTHMMMWALHSLEKVLNGSTNGSEGAEIAVWARPNLTDQLHYVLEVTPELFSNCESRFGQPLLSGKSGKFDIVVLPEYSDQKSSLGLLFIGEDEMGPSYASQEILHENLATLVVRQWFGRLVSLEDLSSAWVRNGINYYLAIQVVAMGHQDLRHNMSRLLSIRLKLMERDSLPKTRELTAHLRGHVHRELRHSKMCLLTHMLCMAIGEKAFYDGIKNFFKHYANMTVSPKILWQEIQQAGRRALHLPLSLQLGTVMQSWFQQPGYPLITVLRDDLNKTVTLRQQRYIQTSGMGMESKSCWWLPIMYITKTHPVPQTEWLGCHKNSPELRMLELRNIFEGPDEWFLVNTEVAAPIRVYYDLQNWHLLTVALRENFTQVPEVSRAALLDDALHLSWAGYLPYGVTLDLMRYLQNETSHLVWQTAISSLEKLHSIMHLTTGYRIFKLYIKQLVGPPFKEVLKTMSSSDNRPLLKPKSLGTESISSLGAMLYRLACQFDIQECMTDALNKFKEAMTSGSTATIPEGLRGTVLCIGIRHGAEEFWLMVRDMYRQTHEETEKRVLLNSLSCTTEYWALRKLLLWALDRKVVPRSLTVGLLASLLKGYLGYYLGKQFLVESMDQI
ncbi:hypothetical protein KR067_002566, partial [Drosophila pandora]